MLRFGSLFLAPSLYSVLNVLFPISSFCPAQDEPGFFICRGGLMLAPAPECLPLEVIPPPGGGIVAQRQRGASAAAKGGGESR